MIWKFNKNALRAMAIGAASLVTIPVIAVEDTTQALSDQLEAVEILTTFGDQLKSVITTDLGATEAQVARWHEAVDAAFAEDLVEADFLLALERETSAESREAALAYETSDLAVGVREHVDTVFDKEEPGALLAAGESYVESASASENALLVDLFAAQRAPERDKAEMDVYFRAMAMMAEPITGAEAAAEWVESAQYLRDDYSEGNFLVRAAAYSTLPEAQLAEVVAALNEPLIVEFSGQLVVALSEAMHAAANRIETEYN